MMALRSNKSSTFNGLMYTAGTVFLAVWLLPAPVWAAQPDPFDVTIGSDWVTVDAYANTSKAADQNPTRQPVSEVSATAGAPTNAAGEQRIATPTRALNFPVMPGLAASSPVTVTTTSNDTAIDDRDQQGWTNIQETQEAVQQEARAKQVLAEQSQNGFHVRLPVLPSPEIQSVPASRVSSGKLALEAKAAALEAKAKRTTQVSLKQTQTTTEACEALASYRRHQLQALESDRKTLAQLKKVLSELGLTSKLDFMTDAEDSLLVAPQKEASAGAPVKVP